MKPIIITKKTNRCALCNGREVLTFTTEEVISSLKVVNGKNYCVDRDECSKNIISEGTNIHYSIDETGELQVVGLDVFDPEMQR